MAYSTISKLIIRIKLCIALLLSFAATAIAHTEAATYAVQVGAFATPAASITNAYKSYGSVRVQRDNGLSRVLIGSFQNREDAQLLLMELKRDGFTDAFVRMLDAAPADAGTIAHKHLPNADLRRLGELTIEEKSQAVYLDGVLHLKQGDQFIPLK